MQIRNTAKKCLKKEVQGWAYNPSTLRPNFTLDMVKQRIYGDGFLVGVKMSLRRFVGGPFIKGPYFPQSIGDTWGKGADYSILPVI